MTLTEAKELIGGLSTPSKMPCQSYSTSARDCVTGSKLQNVPGSVCAGCYALRGNYRFSNVKNSHARRLAALSNPLWAQAMALVINSTEASGFFRWHDSGDVQSVAHLEKIVEVCRLTPKILHWLPTREFGMVAEYKRKFGAFPSNLTVRLSALKIDGPAPVELAKNLGVLSSAVSTSAYSCPAPSQGNACLLCRKCWDKDTPVVTYKKH